jgi:hypothetical protein
MIYRILSLLAALGMASSIVDVAPAAWTANRWSAFFVILAASLTVLRWLLDAIEGEKSK